MTWALYVLNQTNPPQVFSTSYADTESSVARDYAIRVCNTFAQLGARGISVIFGSGDTGVDNEAPRQDVTNTTRFEPSFPGGWLVFYPSTVFVGLNLSSLALTSRVLVELSGML